MVLLYCVKNVIITIVLNVIVLSFIPEMHHYNLRIYPNIIIK